jgi:hypothetical protein
MNIFHHYYYLLESKVSDQAHKLGLEFLGWGKWGKNGNITHLTKNGKLLPVNTAPSKNNVKKPIKQAYKPKEPSEGPTKENFDSNYSYKTKKGSAILGTTHKQPGQQWDAKSKHFVDTVILPNAINTAALAIKQGKKVSFIAEGGVGNLKNDNEQKYIYQALRKKFGKHIIADGEADDLDYSNTESRIYSEVESRLKINRIQSISAFLAGEIGQGASQEEIMNDWFGDDEKTKKQIKNEWKKNGAANPNDPAQLYKLAFPQDFKDGKPNTVSKVWNTLNTLRQESLEKKIVDNEKSGNVSIATWGASHAFDIKQKHKPKMLDF